MNDADAADVTNAVTEMLTGHRFYVGQRLQVPMSFKGDYAGAWVTVVKLHFNPQYVVAKSDCDDRTLYWNIDWFKPRKETQS